MSVFTPFDVRGPDQRRKALLARVAQQAHQRVPTPGRSQAPFSLGTGGRSPRSIGGLAHRLARPNVTQGNNILSSIMDRLGIVGHNPFDGEFSPGPGMPIPGHGHGMPIVPPTPSPAPPIPPFGGPPLGGAQPGAAPAPPIPAGPAPNAGSLPTAAVGAPSPGAANAGGYAGDAGSSSPFAPLPADNPVTSADASGAPPGTIPLGNGMYYDPATNSIIGGSPVYGASGRVFGSQ